jgi:putative membrane protein
MLEQIQIYLAGLPSFLSYFAIGAILLTFYIILYNRITHLNEWNLIKQNESAAAIAFSGSLIGFVIPLASAIENAQSDIECILWGIVALVVQLSAFFAVRLFMPAIAEQIRKGEVASGVLLATISLCVGIINAASMFF